MLQVEAGGWVGTCSHSTTSYLGDNSGSTGTATITGVGSMWTNTSALYVGRLGAGSLTITAGGLVSVRRSLTIDSNGGGDSFVNMSTGGMLALWGRGDLSLAQFLGLFSGTDAMRYWNSSLADWAPLTAATLGVDYTLQYQTAGDLLGYTLLTVGTLPPEGDFNLDGRVDGADFLAWQRGTSPMPHSPDDLATWQANFAPGATAPVPDPQILSLLGLATLGLLVGRRSTRGRTR